tara:strand:+ start:118 stop:1446 length:1329 start_codon:yes stop_codon:yes gene_type:complete
MAVTINPLKISGGRRRLSTFSLFNRAGSQQQGGDDPGTRLALQQNQAALNTINASLITVTQQITLLSASLTNISKEVKQSAALERIKAAQDAKQQRMLAERKLRDEKELLFEKKIQSALISPLRVIGAKTRFTLQRLGQFFNLLLGGFIVSRSIALIRALVSGDKEKLKEIQDKLLKELGIAGGIFLGINGGFGIVLSSMFRISTFLTSVAINGLLIQPIKIIFGKIIPNIINAIVQGIRGVRTPPTGPIIPPKTGKGNQPPIIPPRNTVSLTRWAQRFGRNLFGNTGFAGISLALGADVDDTVGGLLGASLLPLLTTNPYGATALSIIGLFGGAMAPDLLRDQLGLNFIGGDKSIYEMLNKGDVIGAVTAGNNQDRLRQITNFEEGDRNEGKIKIVMGDDQFQGDDFAELDSANLLSFISSANSSNPYLLNSAVQYNIGVV